MMTELESEAYLGPQLYSHPNDPISHQVRLALAEKQIGYRLELIDPLNRPDDLATLSPYNSLPVWVDRHLRLFDSRVILEYLDDRYPATRLLPDSPLRRAEMRQLASRLERDWLRLADLLFTAPESIEPSEQAQARQTLSDSLVNVAALFDHRPFFMSERFGLCDCLLAPVLWRANALKLNLPLPAARPLLAYCQRLFDRPSFQKSLTDAERLLRPPQLQSVRPLLAPKT